jgi:hypothetical protein
VQERVVREIRTLRVMLRELETGLWTHVPVTAPLSDPTAAGKTRLTPALFLADDSPPEPSVLVSFESVA